MDKETVESIKEAILGLVLKKAETVEGSKTKIGKHSFTLDNNSFQEIGSAGKETKLAFIDGGSAELIKGTSFSVSMIRLFCVVYKDNKRISNFKEEFYVVVSAQKTNETEDSNKDSLGYSVSLKSNNCSLDFAKLEETFDSSDASMRTGFTRMEPSVIIDAVRRFAELEFARVISKKIEAGSCIVIDGDLEPKITNESIHLGELQSSCARASIGVVGVSKTTSLMTEQGVPIAKALSVLNKNNPSKAWLYSSSLEGSPTFSTAFAKLHKRSKHIFRIDSFATPEATKFVVSALAHNSSDPVFFGYPYGLVEVDKFARISNQEKEYYLTKLVSNFGNLWKEIEPYLSASDAHSILDNIC